MIISTNWLKKYTDIDLPIDELATLIGSRLVEIEEVIDLGAKYRDVVVASVVEARPLEDSDHLNVTKLDDGGVVKDVERDESGYVQVVCGAPNVREGIFVAWLPPKSTVPETYEDKEPFVLGARKLRGVMSNGMIASAKELALYDEHDGILELDGGDLTPGISFAKYYELDDYLLDIENKSLTHRPDTFGIIGFAREVAAIAGKAFHTPDWLQQSNVDIDVQQSAITPPIVTIDDLKLSERYQAIILSNADGNAKSPLWLQTYLSRVGVRPISAVVDVTNYLMMLTGQPLHAFDYDKVLAVSGGKAHIHVRAGRANEQLELLDGRTIQLAPEDIVISAGETAIGLAGAMGGANTVIDSTTKNIILESATFNLYNLRATQMRHGIFSEAITRFTKGQPAELTAPVLGEAVSLLQQYAGANVSSPICEAYPSQRKPVTLSVSLEKINGVLGSNISKNEASKILRHVEFVAESNDSTTLKVQVPYWRADIHIPEDIIEEIGRLRGFDTITPTLPIRNFTAVQPSSFDMLRANLRKILVRAGANEVLSYSFVHGDILKKAGQKTENSYRITNSISPDLQFYRQSLTPSLLKLIHPNIKAGYEKFALFEMNKAHNKAHGLNEENVPGELHFLTLTLAHKKAQAGSAYYEARAYLDYIATSLGLEFRYETIKKELDVPVAAPFEYRRSALVTDVASGEFIGIIGEYKQSVTRQFKLPSYVAGFEIGPEALRRATEKLGYRYSPLSRYPGTERDICFQVPSTVEYQEVYDAVQSALSEVLLETSITPIDIYQPDSKETKNITLRISLTAHDRTLNGDEVTEIIDIVTAAVTSQTGARVV